MHSIPRKDVPWTGSPTRGRSPSAIGVQPQSSSGDDQQQRSTSQPTMEQGPPAKRRRAAIACGSCRARKSRCDGVRPRCSMCNDLGFDCRYQQPATYPNMIIGKEYLSSIEDRLKIIEDRLFSSGTLTPPASYGPVGSDLPVLPTQENSAQEDGMDRAIETACLTEDAENSAGMEDSIDGMGAVTFMPEEDCAFFGPSSNITLLRDISRAVARIGRTGTPWAPSPVTQQPDAVEAAPGKIAIASPPSSLRYSFSDPYNSSARMNNNQKVNIYALPPEPLARELIRRYFFNTGQLFPYIHQQTFLGKYNQMKKDNFRGVRRMWLGLLNVVFAMATSVSLSPDGQVSGAARRAAESEIYYRRASGICSEQIALGKGMGLDAVQYLLLMCQYLQGTQKSVQTWVTHGLAIKVAMQLGLHSSEASKGYPLLEQEIRKRTWFACVVLDRTLSMTFGRPPTIPEGHVKLELPVPYSSAIPGHGLDKLDTLSVSFFNSTLTLYRVMSSVIDSLYDHNLGCGVSISVVETVTRVFKLENDLAQWQRESCTPVLVTANDLPGAIIEAEATTFATPGDEESELIPPSWWPVYELRLRVIITLRYNNLRILLHRPVLTSLLTRAGNDETGMDDVSITRQVGSSSVQICTRSAKEVIGIVCALVRSKGPARGLLGAWWFSLYYTFNAALVIVAGVLVSIEENKDPSITIVKYNQDARPYLHEAIEALRSLDGGRRMIARCREYLEQLMQVLQSLLSSRCQDLGFDFRPQEHPSGGQDLLQHGDAMSVTLSEGSFIYQNQSAAAHAQSPLGIELGEFFMDHDLNFLNDHMYTFGSANSNSL